VEFISQSIPEIILIKPTVHGDERGYFCESFRQDQFQETIGFPVHFIQENESRSSKGVLRGLHFQRPPYAQSKLVRVLDGKVLDLVVDIRCGGPTYGKHVAVELSAKNKHQLWIPRGFAHGFVVLSDFAIFAYKIDNYYAPDQDCGIAFDDPQLNIDWKFPHEKLILSNKDLQLSTLYQLEEFFQYGQNLYDM